MSAAITIAAIGTGASILGGAKASKAQKKANEAQRRINRLRNKQAKRDFMKRFRQAQGAALQQGIMAGLGFESSSVQGALASEKAQMTTALGEFKEMDRLGGEINASMNRVSKYNFQSQVAGQAAGFAAQFIGGTSGG